MGAEIGGGPPDEQLMTLGRADRAGWAVLVVRGAVDIATEGRLLTAARAPLVARRRLVVDLTAVDFLSSSGAGQLVALADESRRHRAALRIVTGQNRRVGQLVLTLGLDRALPIFGSVEEAISG